MSVYHRILFIEPRAPMEHVFSRVRIPRLGTVLLGTILRDLGYEVRVLIEEISGAAGPRDFSWADCVCLSSTTSTAPRAYRLGESARAQGKPVLYGGPHVTFLAEEALAHGDVVVRGEGEETLVELLAAMNGTGRLEGVRGISYRDADGRAVHAPERALVADLDTLPIPDFSLVRGWNPRRSVVPIATSRGCPHACKFCSVVQMFGRGYRTRSVDLVLEEIRRNGRQARHLFFCDDNFFANPARAKELLRRMKAEGPPREWSTQVRAESAFDAEFLALLRETNCHAVYIGFESANPETLKAYRKRQGVEQMRAAIAAFRAAGIRMHGMFIFGADQDTPASLRETVRFAQKNRLDSVQFLTLTPLPGTETFRELRDADRLLTTDWELYDGAHVVHRPRNMTAYELQRAWYRGYLAFYSRTAILRRLLKRDLYYTYIRLYARRLVKRAKVSMRHYRRWLAGELRARVRQMGDAREFSGVKKVAVMAGNAGDSYRRFLAQFLSRLGIEVVESAEAKAQLVVVPMLRHVQEMRLPPALEQLRTSLQKMPEGLASIELVIDLKRESLYRSCLLFGLHFSRSVRRVRRAYEKTLRACGPIPEYDSTTS